MMKAFVKHLCLSHIFSLSLQHQCVASSLLVSVCETTDLLQHRKLTHKVLSSEPWLSLWNTPTSSSDTKQGLLVAQQHLPRIWEPGHRLLVKAALTRQADEMFSGHHLRDADVLNEKNGLLCRPCRAETVKHQRHLALFPHKLFQDGSQASRSLQRVNRSKILQLHRKKWPWAHNPAVYCNHKRCV